MAIKGRTAVFSLNGGNIEYYVYDTDLIIIVYVQPNIAKIKYIYSYN